MGELIRQQKETVGLATGGDAMRARFQTGTEVKPTLSDAGISKKLSIHVTLTAPANLVAESLDVQARA